MNKDKSHLVAILAVILGFVLGIGAFTYILNRVLKEG